MIFYWVDSAETQKEWPVTNSGERISSAVAMIVLENFGFDAMRLHDHSFVRQFLGKERGLFGAAPRVAATKAPASRRRGFVSRVMGFLRREFFDRFGRR